MHAKSVSGFVIVGSAGIIIEHPPSVLGAARLVDEPPDLFVRAVPKTAHAAMLTVLLPKMRVDVPLAVQRSHELITVACRAGRKSLRPGEMKPDALERVCQC